MSSKTTNTEKISKHNSIAVSTLGVSSSGESLNRSFINYWKYLIYSKVNRFVDTQKDCSFQQYNIYYS